MCVGGGGCYYGCVPVKDNMGCLLLSTLLFEAGSFAEPGAHSFLAWQARKYPGSAGLPRQCCGYRCSWSCLAFKWVWDPPSGPPHTCTASALPTEPPHPHRPAPIQAFSENDFEWERENLGDWSSWEAGAGLWVTYLPVMNGKKFWRTGKLCRYSAPLVVPLNIVSTANVSRMRDDQRPLS